VAICGIAVGILTAIRTEIQMVQKKEIPTATVTKVKEGDWRRAHRRRSRRRPDGTTVGDSDGVPP
jgi:hypothetical protein